MGKKEKKKSVFVSLDSYQKKFESLYNNKKNSDFTIKFEGSSEELYVKKVFLAINSDFFENIDGSFTFPKEDDVKSVKAMINFYYTGKLDITDEGIIVPFVLLSKKYKTKNMADLKLPGKLVLNGVLTYIEKDLENRKSEFDSLSEIIDFKKISESELKKLYSKKKWLQYTTSFLQIIVMSIFILKKNRKY
jgi:hypothetical protein